MGKFILTKEDKKSIRSLYGLNEQTITLPLPISDTFTSYDEDSAHRLTGLEKKIDIALEKIYNQGINPKMYDVKLQVVRNGNTFTTSSSLIIDKSNDGKAWTGFATRGSIGYDYVNRADGQIDGSANADGRSLKEKLESGADAVEIIPISNSPITINNVQLKQYFVQFTKSSKPNHASSKPTPKNQTELTGAQILEKFKLQVPGKSEYWGPYKWEGQGPDYWGYTDDKGTEFVDYYYLYDRNTGKFTFDGPAVRRTKNTQN